MPFQQILYHTTICLLGIRSAEGNSFSHHIHSNDYCQAQPTSLAGAHTQKSCETQAEDGSFGIEVCIFSLMPAGHNVMNGLGKGPILKALALFVMFDTKFLMILPTLDLAFFAAVPSSTAPATAKRFPQFSKILYTIETHRTS